MSRYHLVVEFESLDRLLVRDLHGNCHVASLLAWEGERPQVGDYVVAHSGFALGLADPDEVAEARRELDSVRRKV